MTQQLNNQVFAYAKQFSENAFKAQSVALQGMQQIAGLQLDAFEKQSRALADFFSVATEARDADGLRGLWEKSATLSRESAEQAVAVTQEVVAVSRTMAESLGTLAQAQRAANDAVVPSAAAFKAAAAK